MEACSVGFRTALAQPMREALDLRVVCDLSDRDAAADAYAIMGDRAPWATYPYYELQPQPLISVATFEPGRFVLDAGLTAMSDDLRVNEKNRGGWVSGTLTDAEGKFSSAAKIGFTFTQTFTLPAITFNFGQNSDDFPSAARLEVYKNDVLRQSLSFTPDAQEFTVIGPFNNFDMLYLCVDAMHRPQQHARLLSVTFGYVARFDCTHISALSTVCRRDPLCRSLPTERLQLSLSQAALAATKGMAPYNPEHPEGMWQYIEQPMPLVAYCALPVNGVKEWLMLGRYMLDGSPHADEKQLTLTAEGQLTYLTQPYEDLGYFYDVPRNFSELAIDVLFAAKLPHLPGDMSPFDTAVALGAYTTLAPLKGRPLRECLQYIAHAAGAMLYTDRRGAVCVEMEDTNLQDMSLAYDTLLQVPQLTKAALPAAVVVKVYTYKKDEDGKMNTSTTEYTLTLPDAPKGAQIETVDNPLITDTTLAAVVAARTADYLRRRISYAAAYRGDPTLDVGDWVSLQTAGSAAAEVQIMEQKLNFDSGISGSVVAKRREVG